MQIAFILLGAVTIGAVYACFVAASDEDDRNGSD